MNKKKMTLLNDSKFKRLSADIETHKNIKTFAICSIFLNIVASIVAGKPLGPNARSFLSKIIDAFDETYEGPSPAYKTALRKLDCFERYVKALEEPNKAKKKRMIDYVISDVERWKLFKGKELSKVQRDHLREELPKWRNKRPKTERLALERSEILFGEYYYSLKRHRRDRKKYEIRLNAHYANDLEHDVVAFVTLQHTLHVRGKTLKDILKVLWRDGFRDAKTPANSGQALLNLFHSRRHTLADLVYPELNNRGRLNW